MSIARDLGPRGQQARLRSLREHPAGGRRSPGLVSLVTKRPDLVEVSSAGAQLGYIEVVGSVFVVLAGERYDLAVEVSQKLQFEDALRALTASAER